MKIKEPKKYLVAVAVVLLAISVIGNVFLFMQLKESRQNPDRQAQAAIERLVAEVSQYMVLPKDEVPTVATVTDPAKLKEQTFFNNATVGDKVIIYTNAKKAILYSPTAHKIIEVAPINIGAGTQAPAPAPVAPEPTDSTTN